jgi:uncharacterized protein YabN with tetrapyrrole methylase and pyrophosphatase domain
VAGELVRFHALVQRLRAECPWDAEQTHASLTRHLLEETYEVLEAIDHVDAATGAGFEHLEEELGDLLFAVVNLARLAGAHAMQALGAANRKFSDRFVALEGLASERGIVLGAASLEELDALWDEVKRRGR